MVIVDEIGRLMVRLVGDGSSFQKMMTEAKEATESTAETIKNFTAGIEGFANSAASALAAVGLGGGLAGAFGAFSEEEDALIRLRAALRASGQEVEGNIRTFQAFATEIQATTRFSDEHVLSLIAQAHNMRVFGNAATQAVQDAMRLGAAVGRDPNSLLRVTTAMGRGDIEKAMKFARRIPGLMGIKDEEEFRRQYSSLAGSGILALAEQADTATGKITRMRNAMSDVMEQIGALVADAIKPVVDGFRSFAEWLGALPPVAKKAAVAITGIVTAVLAVEPILKHFDRIVGAITSPIDILVALTGTWLALVVERIGGINQAWEEVKRQARSVIEWFTPIGQAIKELGEEVIQTAVFIYDSFKRLVTQAWNAVKSVIATNLEGINRQITIYVNNVKDFIRENREAIFTVTELAIVIAGLTASLYGAYRAFRVVLSVIVALRVPQLAMFMLWVAWKGVVLAFNLALGVFNVVIVLYTVNLALLKGVMLLASAATSAATIVIGLFSVGVSTATAAMTLLASILSGTAIVTFAVTLLAILATLSMVLGAIGVIVPLAFALADAFSQITSGISEFSNLGTAFRNFVPVFEEWRGVIGMVVRAFRTDLPLAIEITQAAWALAVAQFQTMWPPTWEFLKQGFNSLWELVTTSLSGKMGQAFHTVVANFITALRMSMRAMFDSGFLPMTEEMFHATDNLLYQTARGHDLDAATAMRNTNREVERLQGQIREIIDTGINFNLDTPEIRAARTELERLQGLLVAAEERARNERNALNRAGAGTTADAEAAGRRVGGAFNKGVKGEIQKLDAVIRGSAEALTRIANYRDQQGGFVVSQANRDQANRDQAARRQAIDLIGAGAAGQMLGLLGTIANNTGVVAQRPPVQIQPANLEDD